MGAGLLEPRRQQRHQFVRLLIDAGATYLSAWPRAQLRRAFLPVSTVTTLSEALPRSSSGSKHRGQNINDRTSPEADYDGDGMTVGGISGRYRPASAASVLALNGWFSASDHHHFCSGQYRALPGDCTN